jgi:hypothetical protein
MEIRLEQTKEEKISTIMKYMNSIYEKQRIFVDDIEKYYKNTSLGIPRKHDAYIEMFLETLPDEQLDKIYTQMSNNMKYISKLRVSGIKSNFYLYFIRNPKTDEYKLKSRLMYIDTTTDIPFTFDCKNMDNGDMWLNYLFLVDVARNELSLDVRHLNVDDQPLEVLEKMCQILEDDYTKNFCDNQEPVEIVITIIKARLYFKRIVYDQAFIDRVISRVVSLSKVYLKQGYKKKHTFSMQFKSVLKTLDSLLFLKLVNCRTTRVTFNKTITTVLVSVEDIMKMQGDLEKRNENQDKAVQDIINLYEKILISPIIVSESEKGDKYTPEFNENIKALRKALYNFRLASLEE